MCEICRRTFSCHPRCPNYKPHTPLLFCSYCGEGIYEGEEYIENDNGEYRHWDCVCGLRDLAGWLGYEIKTMEKDYD